MTTMPVDKFDGEYRFLSNFDAHGFISNSVYWKTVENFYQANKTEDPKICQLFIELTPAQAKIKGRKIQVRPNWDSIKVFIMVRGVYLKFSNPMNDSILQKLFETGYRELVEKNWWHDAYWGQFEGEGLNKLGRILMGVREYLANPVNNNYTEDGANKFTEWLMLKDTSLFEEGSKT